MRYAKSMETRQTALISMSVPEGQNATTTNVLLLEAVRAVLDHKDDWTLYDEGTWEEYARAGGVYFEDVIETIRYLRGLIDERLTPLGVKVHITPGEIRLMQETP